MTGKLIHAKTKQVFDIEAGSTLAFETHCPLCHSDRSDKNQKKKECHVDQQLRTARCNHCGEGFKFLYDYEFNKGTITDHLSGKGLEPLGEKLLNYIVTQRRISKETLTSCEVKQAWRKILDKETGNYIQRLCIAFPYYDGSVLRMVKYRDNQKNFSIDKGSRLIFYGLNYIRKEKEAIIVEGEFDRLAYFEAGIKNVVSVPNGVTISQEERDHFEKTGEILVTSQINLKYLDESINDFEDKEVIYLATDSDAAGMKLREELIRRFGKQRCRVIDYSKYPTENTLKPCKDANDVLIHHGAEMLRSTLKEAREFPMENVVTVSDVEDQLMYQFQHGLEKGKTTGYPALDPHFTLLPGYTIALNGHMNMGKTAFSFNLMMLSALMYDWKWGAYCPENYPTTNVFQMLTEIYVGKTLDLESRDRMNMSQYNAALDFIRSHFFFVDNPENDSGYTPEALRDICRNLIRKKGINGFLTDPWNGLYHKLGNMALDQYLETELSAEVRLTTKSGIIKLINVHPPTPIRQKDTVYRHPTAYEIRGGNIWANKMYGIICVDIPKTENWREAKSEIYVQKVKDHKLVGIPTYDQNPIILEYDRKNRRYIQETGYDPYEQIKGKGQVTMEFEAF